MSQVDAVRQLREAADLLLLVEQICERCSQNAAEDLSKSVPWGGIRVSLKESRRRIESVVGSEVQHKQKTGAAQSQAQGSRSIAARIQRLPEDAGHIREVELDPDGTDGEEALR